MRDNAIDNVNDDVDDGIDVIGIHTSRRDNINPGPIVVTKETGIVESVGSRRKQFQTSQALFD